MTQAITSELLDNLSLIFSRCFHTLRIFILIYFFIYLFLQVGLHIYLLLIYAFVAVRKYFYTRI